MELFDSKGAHVGPRGALENPFSQNVHAKDAQPLGQLNTHVVENFLHLRVQIVVSLLNHFFRLLNLYIE